MADIGMRLDGFEGIERRLRRLPDKVKQQAVPKALRVAATVARRAIRNATPIGPTGNLRRSTTIRIRRYAAVTVAVIGHKWPTGAHAHLLEEGTEERTRETIGGAFASANPESDSRSKSTGRMAATHFIERAFKAIQGRLTIVYGKALIAEVERIIRVR